MGAGNGDPGRRHSGMHSWAPAPPSGLPRPHAPTPAVLTPFSSPTVPSSLWAPRLAPWAVRVAREGGAARTGRGDGRGTRQTATPGDLPPQGPLLLGLPGSHPAVPQKHPRRAWDGTGTGKLFVDRNPSLSFMSYLICQIWQPHLWTAAGT